MSLIEIMGSICVVVFTWTNSVNGN